MDFSRLVAAKTLVIKKAGFAIITSMSAGSVVDAADDNTGYNEATPRCFRAVCLGVNTS